MPSRVEIVNMALALIGADSITSMGDETESARKASVMYEIVRDEVLRGHPYAFATKRFAPPALATTPIYEYALMYQLPNDCLRLLSVNNGDEEIEDYEIEGRNILTNRTTIYIKYTARITDESQFDSLFVSAFATRLASSLAFPLADSSKLAEELLVAYGKLSQKAEGINSQEAGMPDIIGADSFIRNRY